MYYMSLLSRKTPFILLIGDIFVFALALWSTLLVRYQSVPSENIVLEHILPFSVLFCLWIIVYFIKGLYEKRAVVLGTTLSQHLLQAQFVNAGISVAFFYFVSLDIAPKTNLFLYLAISSIFIFVWRMYVYNKCIPARNESAVMVGGGKEVKELVDEVNNNPHYNFKFTTLINLDLYSHEGDKDSLYGNHGILVVDFYNKKIESLLPDLYKLFLNRTRFIDMHQMYESVFGRVALSVVGHGWFIENISAYPKHLYDLLKRCMDFSVAGIVGSMSLVLYPFVYLAIKLDDGGPVFIFQERIGKDNKIVRIPKFRSMKTSDKGVWVKENDDRITRVGKFLRKARIDELPQLFSVLKGDMSLVGPRPDIYDLGVKLSEEIPYYTLRTLIKPGLSGWAQIRQELPPQSLEETKIRLAYDFYYIKNRSVFLDLKIALQTISTLLSRSGK